MRLLLGDCVDRMAEMPDGSVESVVCDPPYGLEFLGSEWDSFKTGRSAAYAAGGELNTKNMQARSGKGGAGPAYVKRAAKRCRACGKQQWSGSPCKCVDPEWEIDNSPYSRSSRGRPYGSPRSSGSWNQGVKSRRSGGRGSSTG